jgi:hypothetical protein
MQPDIIPMLICEYGVAGSGRTKMDVYAKDLTLRLLRLTPYALRLTPYALRLTPLALKAFFAD